MFECCPCAVILFFYWCYKRFNIVANYIFSIQSIFKNVPFYFFAARSFKKNSRKLDKFDKIV